MGESKHVLIVGYGEMGHAMQHLLGSRHKLVFYDSRPIEGLAPINLEKAAARADFVIFCIPTQPLEQMLRIIVPKLQAHAVCISISKGLDDQGRTPTEVYRLLSDGSLHYSLLYGPMISEEICAGRAGFADLGSSHEDNYKEVYKLFEGSGLHIRECSDITGISWSVILKNIYAIAFGVADALQLGDNVRGYLTVIAMQELCAIMETMGGKSETALRLAGLGDLICTATSAGSHHHELGSKLARGEGEGISGEGIHTLSMVKRYGFVNISDYPLFDLVNEMVENPTQAKELIYAYVESCG